MAVGVGDVDLGLEGAGRRVEREARADDLALTGDSRDRLEADQGRVLVVDEERGQLGDAHEDADRVDLLEDEERPAVGAAAGLEVVARADVALGDHAVVRGLDLPVLDLDLGLAFVGLGDDQIGAGGLDVDLRAVAIGDRLVERGFRLGDHRVGLVARRDGLLELAVGLVADLHVEDLLFDQRLEPLVLRLPSGVAGLGPLDAGLGRDDRGPWPSRPWPRRPAAALSVTRIWTSARFTAADFWASCSTRSGIHMSSRTSPALTRSPML